MALIKGIDTATLPEQFAGCIAGRTLITDGDGVAYRVAATVKRLDTAIRRFQQEMLTQAFLTKSSRIRVHLTASGSDKAGRYRIIGAKPYQGNRTNKAKPALLEPLREAMANRENWLEEFDFVHLHRELEADDAMMHDAYQLKENGVIWSDDKDLRMTPYLYWEKDTGVLQKPEPIGKLWLKSTTAGTQKCLGQGPLFFWAQMLMGDTADNVQGILTLNGTKCGAVGAFTALEAVQSIHEAANTVLDGYRSIDQNPLPEGWLLWLLRWPGDTFWQYLQELYLTEENRRFVHECAGRKWFTSLEETSSITDEVLGY